MRHAVAAFPAMATLLFPIREYMVVGHATELYEPSRAVGHVGLGGLHATRPVVSAIAADSERSLLALLLLR